MFISSLLFSSYGLPLSASNLYLRPIVRPSTRHHRTTHRTDSWTNSSSQIVPTKLPLCAAWNEACASVTASTIAIPKGTFQLNNVELVGPCKAPLTVKIDIILKAPADPSQIKLDVEWVTFRNVDFLTVTGTGTFDGQGATTWKKTIAQQHENVFLDHFPFSFSSCTDQRYSIQLLIGM